MNGKIKALGLAFVAVVALSAVAASAASANQFHVAQATSTIRAHSEGEHALQLQNTAGTAQIQVKCGTASLEGALATATPTEATVTATYGIGTGSEVPAQGCTLAGLKAQVLMNGCKYTLTGSHTPAGGQAQTIALTGWVDVTGCTSGKKIEVRSPLAGCTLTIGEQTTLSHIVNTNLTQTVPKTVTSAATVSGITVTQDGAGCLDGNGHTSNKASFSGNTLIKAFASGGTAQKTLHNHQYAEPLIGAQIDIQAT